MTRTETLFILSSFVKEILDPIVNLDPSFKIKSWGILPPHDFIGGGCAAGIFTYEPRRWPAAIRLEP
jgi:hypothetical protein